MNNVFVDTNGKIIYQTKTIITLTTKEIVSFELKIYTIINREFGVFKKEETMFFFIKES